MLKNNLSNYVWLFGMVAFCAMAIVKAIEDDVSLSIACMSFSLACCANFRISLLDSEKR